MAWWNKKKSTDNAAGSNSTNSQALATQDPRTRVKTTSAATESTNTAVQNSTIFDNNRNTVTYVSTRQTVTHTQQARVTEMITRRTPSTAELEELLRQMNMNKGTTNSTTTTTTTTTKTGSGANKRSSSSSLNGVALRSTPSFKPSTSEHRRSSTLVKLEQTTMSQKQGRSVTQHVETTRVVLKPSTSTWSPPKPATTTPSTSSSSSSIYKPNFNSQLALKPFDSSYVSPYAKTGTATSSLLSKPIVTSTVLSKPTVTSTTSYGTRPTLSTPKSFISLNPNSGAVPKRHPMTGSVRDARCELRPVEPLVAMPKPKPVLKKKLKAAQVIIFNHEKFDNGNEKREGSAEDVKSLEKTFKELKCPVKVVNNATLNMIKNIVRELENTNFDDRSALVLVILSHGQRNDTIAAKDGGYKLDDDVLFPILRNRSLIDKPKIMFVQACKGSREIGGFKTDAIQPHGNPSEILKCYSTYEGYVSYRLSTGTPFIQTLCDTLIKKPNVDIETIMKDVIGLVKSYTQDGQVPSMTSTMTTKYVFGDYA